MQVNMVIMYIDKSTVIFVAMDVAAWYQSIAMETSGGYQSNVTLQFVVKAFPTVVCYFLDS